MEPIDRAALRENCAGDEDLVREIVELFASEAPQLMGDIATAVTSNDALAIRRTAHRLKGALVSLAAGPCVELSRQLEVRGANTEVHGSAELYKQLEVEMARLLKALSTVSRAA